MENTTLLENNQFALVLPDASNKIANPLLVKNLFQRVDYLRSRINLKDKCLDLSSEEAEITLDFVNELSNYLGG